MKKWFVFASMLALFASLLARDTSAVQGGSPPAQPWSKTCNLGAVGADGCTVTVTMTAGTGCPDNGYEYCVRISTSCPGGPDDPAEDCDSGPICGFCGDTSEAIAITCDGGCYSAQPKTQKTWGDVAVDCGNLAARDASHPCP